MEVLRINYYRPVPKTYKTMKITPVIASLSQSTFKQFFRDITDFRNILDQIHRVEPELSYAYLAEQINAYNAEVLLTGWGSVSLPKSFLQDCPTIRYVCHLTGELRWLLPRSLIQDGLVITNWGSAISDNVAEGALFLILACCRRAANAVMTMHIRHGWDLNVEPPVSLLDKRVGIHGFGNVAQQLTLLLKPFRCSISAYSPPVPNAIFEAFSTKRETSLEHLFEENDVIVELEAFTNHTERLVGKSLLDRIRPGRVFVNAGRGKVVCEQDLEEVASRGLIFIGLDVFSQEPLPSDSPLRGLENVFLTPHFAGPTTDRISLCGKHALANILAYYRGDRLDSVIGVSEYDRMT
jgi:phosphoglycerate dehydrogenase-like enzyme